MIKYRYKWISIYVVGLKSKLFLRKTGQSSAIKLYSNTLNILCVEKFILFFNLVAISPARGWKKFKKARNGWQSVEGRINGFTLARKSDFVMLRFHKWIFSKNSSILVKRSLPGTECVIHPSEVQFYIFLARVL